MPDRGLNPAKREGKKHSQWSICSNFTIVTWVFCTTKVEVKETGRVIFLLTEPSRKRFFLSRSRPLARVFRLKRNALIFPEFNLSIQALPNRSLYPIVRRIILEPAWHEGGGKSFPSITAASRSPVPVLPPFRGGSEDPLQVAFDHVHEVGFPVAPVNEG